MINNADDLKTRSFRISDDVAEKLKQISEYFDNQNAALESLISVYEIQSAKAILTDRQTDISDYDSHLQAIQDAFLHSLEINENAEKRIRTEFQNLLSSKDETIMMLQEQLESAKSDSAKTSQALQELTDRSEQESQEANDRIVEYIKQAEIAEAAKSAAERNAEGAEAARKELHDILYDTKAQLTASRAEAAEAKKRENEYIEKIKNLEQQLADQKQIVVKAENRIERLQSEAAMEKERSDVAKQKAVLEERDKNTLKIQELYEEINNLRKELGEQSSRKNSKQTKSE